MDWQIALQLVRQRESNEPAVAGVQVAEPEEAEVVGSETIADPVEHSSHGQTTETSVEAGMVATDLPADQSQCPAAQPLDSEVWEKLQTLGNWISIKVILYLNLVELKLRNEKGSV
jgi:hypothetical protein